MSDDNHIHFETTLKHVQDAYKKGYIDGVRAFAYWIDGVQYVGTSIIEPLKDIIDKIETLHNYAPPE